MGDPLAAWTVWAAEDVARKAVDFVDRAFAKLGVDLHHVASQVGLGVGLLIGVYFLMSLIFDD